MGRNKKDPEIRELSKMFFGGNALKEDDVPPTEPAYLPPYLNTLPTRYPGVPEPYNYTWERTDTYTKHTEDWDTMFANTEAVLNRALDTCKSYLQRKTPMTVRELHTMETSILHALHTLNDVLTAWMLNYPLPNKTAYSLVAENNDLKKYAPELLLNTQEHILIRLAAMPPKSKASSSHLYHEFTGLLRANRFSSFPYWHCDFVHAFRPENLQGIKDVDNYPYKPIIDALTRTLATKDSTFHFSCGMYNLLSDSIRPGCYISISKRNEKVRFFQDFEELAKSAPESKKDQPIPDLLLQPIPDSESEN